MRSTLIVVDAPRVDRGLSVSKRFELMDVDPPRTTVFKGASTKRCQTVCLRPGEPTVFSAFCSQIASTKTVICLDTWRRASRRMPVGGHLVGLPAGNDPLGIAACVFVAVDHCTTECIGLHAAKRGTRFEALEPIRQGVRARFGTIGEGVARGLRLRHDHGSNYLADDFQQEVAFWPDSSSSGRTTSSGC